VSLTRGSNTSTVVYRGQANFQYILYGSSNTTTWSSLMTNLCTSSSMSFSETNRPIRFYRAVSLKTPLLYQCTFSGIENGEFMVFVRTNDTIALVGYNSGIQGIFANALSVDTNGRYCGTIFPNRTGCLMFTSNAVSGTLSNGTVRTATVSGSLKSSSGPFQGAAGLYSGTLSLDCNGTIKAILASDGTLFLYATTSSGVTEGGTVPVNSNGSFSVATYRNAHYTGALSLAQRVMSGTFTHGCDDGNGTGPFSASRSEKLF
jgi:hypothetical protein